jgi:hypothetical protein
MTAYETRSLVIARYCGAGRTVAGDLVACFKFVPTRPLNALSGLFAVYFRPASSLAAAMRHQED